MKLKHMGPKNYKDDYYEDYDGYEDYDYDSGMSYNQQMWADRSDYADEQYERGEIDEIQRSEIKAGA